MADYFSIRKLDATSPSELSASAKSTTTNTRDTSVTSKTNETELVGFDFEDEKISKSDFIKAELPTKLKGADHDIVFDYLDRNKEGFILKSKLESLTDNEIKDLVSKSGNKRNGGQVGGTSDNNNGNPAGGVNKPGGGNGNGGQVDNNGNNKNTGNVDASSNTNSVDAGQKTTIPKGGIYAPNGMHGIIYENYSETEDVEVLTQQKNDINKAANDETNKLQKEKSELINNKLSGEAKIEHQKLTTSIAQTNNALTQTRANIAQCESKVHSAECSIAQIENELSALEGNADSGSDNEAIQKSRAARKARLQSELTAAKQEKTAAEKELGTQKDNEAQQQQELTGLENSLKQIEAELLKADAELAQKVSGIEAKITDTKGKQNAEVKAIDGKIAQLKTKEMENAKFKGTTEGDTTEISKRALEIGSDPEFIKSFLGDREWCVKFAVGAYNKALAEFGIDYKIPPQSQQLKDFTAKRDMLTQVSGTSSDKRAGITQNLRPGDLLQHNRHVYMVLEVYPDGSYRTLEGNIRAGGYGSHVGSRHEALDGGRAHFTHDMSELTKFL